MIKYNNNLQAIVGNRRDYGGPYTKFSIGFYLAGGATVTVALSGDTPNSINITADPSSGNSQIQVWESGSSEIVANYRTVTGSLVHHYLMTFDAAAGGDQVTYYVDGSVIALNSGNARASSLVSGITMSNDYLYCNTSINAAFGDVCIWDQLLTAKQASALASGISPLLVAPKPPILHIPCLNNLTDFAKSAAGIQSAGTGYVFQNPLWRKAGL